ncbi:MAG TPA: hypothetical protein VHI93_03935, partial [Candidatus Thermoplasmatota archaeon]|nr:hypothetical protein [Candidatus Thermoplasmatota archaeon]
VSLAGTLAAGSTLVTGLPSTAALEVGMRVTGAGVPAAATVATIPSGTSVTLSAAATGSGTATLGFYAIRVPAGIPYGVWAGYTDAACTANAAYAAVVLAGARTVAGTWTDASRTLTGAAGSFSAGDVGRLVVGPGIPGGTTVAAVNSTSEVTLSARPTAAATAASCTLAPDPTHALYGLQLVVWFGA